MPSLNFDAKTVDMPTFEALPEGWYAAVIETTQRKAARLDDGSCMC